MSWFNASQLSSFAKQALSTAQKSIDRVLDIQEEDQWGDAISPRLDGGFQCSMCSFGLYYSVKTNPTLWSSHD